MKKSIIIILAVVAILVIWAVSVYNGLVTMDENVSGQWANVETQYQRRADLIPNLVTTVKEYAEHEKSTFAQITEMRNKSYASFSNQDKENLDSAFSQACTHFFAIAENYPQHALFYKSLCQNQIIGNLEYWDKRHRYYARKLLQSSRGFQK